MRLTEVASNTKPIILVFGRLCSGKGTFCNQYVDQGYHHITTSDVVKQLSNTSERSRLQTTKELDHRIADELINLINQHQPVIIDGIRQVSIVKRLEKEFGDKISKMWLNVPENIRRERFAKRSDIKDDRTFDDAEAGDSQLGLDDVESKYKTQSNIIDHY